MEIAFQQMLIVGETPLQLLEGGNRQGQVLQLVLVNHRHVIQPIDDDDVGSGDILRRHRQLLEIILATFRVVGGDGGRIRNGSLRSFALSQ